MDRAIDSRSASVVNHWLRRACPCICRIWPCTVALVLCTPALLADTFDPGQHGAFQKSSLSAGKRATDIQVLVEDFQASSLRNQAVSSRAKFRARRAANADMKFDEGDGQRQQNDYLAAASLASQLIGVDPSTRFGKSQSGAVNSALWNLIFRPASSHQASASHSGGTRYPAQAQGGKGPHGIAAINIWKAEPKKTPRRAGIRVPEPSLGSLLLFNAVALALAGLFLRCRGVGFVP
jgi:hypothetical protein